MLFKILNLLFQHIQEPTHYRLGTTTSLLDLVFTSEANNNHIGYFPGLGSSDHVCIRFHLSCYSTFKLHHIPRYNVKRADFHGMCAAFHTINWPVIICMEPWIFMKHGDFQNGTSRPY